MSRSAEEFEHPQLCRNSSSSSAWLPVFRFFLSAALCIFSVAAPAQQGSFFFGLSSAGSSSACSSSGFFAGPLGFLVPPFLPPAAAAFLSLPFFGSSSSPSRSSSASSSPPSSAVWRFRKALNVSVSPRVDCLNRQIYQLFRAMLRTCTSFRYCFDHEG